MWIATKRGELSGFLEEQWLHFSNQTFVFLIDDITQGAGEEVDVVTRGVSGMGVDRIGEVDDSASEGLDVGVYGTDLW